MTMQTTNSTAAKSATHYPVIVDGLFLGYVARDKAPLLERRLRALKVDQDNKEVPYTTEITLIRYSTDVKQVITQFPGLYIYTCIARMIRPVTNLAAKKTEYIGKFLDRNFFRTFYFKEFSNKSICLLSLTRRKPSLE